MKGLLIILLLVISTASFGQTAAIKGKVIIKVTGEAPEDYVYVQVQGQSRLGSVTDSLGRFVIAHLQPDTQYVLELSGFGYPTLLVEVNPKAGTTFLNFELNIDCEYNKEKAQKDIAAGKARLLLIGSIGPIANTDADDRFEKKYKVRYLDFGCTPPALDCVKAYNKTVFKHLDSTYGSRWRKEVRRDVVFLE